MKNKSLPYFLIIALFMGSFGIVNAQGNLKDSLIAYWNFDDSTAHDVTGHGHNGTFHGMPANVSGAKGNAKHFNGDSDYVSIPNSTALNLGSGSLWSISLWYYEDTAVYYSNVQPIVCKMTAGTGSPDADYYIFDNSNLFTWGNGEATDTVSWMQINQPSIKKWHHIVVTYKKLSSGFFKKLYVDGVLLKSGIGYTKASANTEDLYLAYSWDGNGQHYFKGDIDEVRIYNRELTDCDVAALYKFGNVLTGTISISTGAPLKNTKVDMVTYNPADSTIKSVGSTTTDSTGYYCFTVFDSSVYLIASPDSGTYPHELPTYYDSSVDFTSAKSVSIKNGINTVNFKTLYGSNPGGSGFIGGKITLCAMCKNAASGAPAANLKVILMDANGKPQKYTYTDKNGNFSFGKLALKTYKVYVDRPNVNNKYAPQIALTTGKTSMANLKFTLYPSMLELDTNTISGIHDAWGYPTQVQIFPNPASGILNVKIDMGNVIETTVIRLISTLGTTVQEKVISNNEKAVQFDVSNLTGGIYFVEIKGDSYREMHKLIVK